MTTVLEDERVFPCSVERLYACWVDPEFQRARSRHLGAARQRCWVEGEGGATVVRLSEARETGFGTAPFESVHTTRWSPTATGHAGVWTLEQTGGPGSAAAEGSVALIALEESRCRLELRGTLTIDVPRLGRWIERAARLGFRRERRKEAEFIAGWLRRTAHPDVC